MNEKFTQDYIYNLFENKAILKLKIAFLVFLFVCVNCAQVRKMSSHETVILIHSPNNF